MKTFKQLSIGEKFYMVYTNYEGREKPKWREMIEEKIEIEYRDGEKRFIK